MTRRIKLLSRVLLAFFVACALACLTAWAVVLMTLCSSPRKPMPETQHVIAYNCHGMSVFISPLQEALRDWLMPGFIVFSLLSVLAAAMVFLASAKVTIRIRVHRTDASNGSPRR